MVLRVAFSHVKNSLDAEDVAQEVFLALLKAPTITDEKHLKSWLIRVAINKSRNITRSFARRKTVALEAAEYKKYNLDEGDIDLIESVNKLPAIERDIVYLHYFEGYTAKEIGEILNKKESAVFARLRRIKSKLKDILEDGHEKLQGNIQQD